MDALKSLTATARMPVLFLGHGSPMNAMEDNEYRRSWQTLGAEFGLKWPKLQLILCISAPWHAALGQQLKGLRAQGVRSEIWT